MVEPFDWNQETYTESAGGEFIDNKLFKKWLYNDETVYVTDIREGHSKKFDEDQWLIDFVGPDSEEYTKSVGKGNPERDARFKRILSTIGANNGEPFECRFVEVGKRIDLGPAKS